MDETTLLPLMLEAAKAFIRIANRHGFGPALPTIEYTLRYYTKGTGTDSQHREMALQPIYDVAREEIKESPEILALLDATKALAERVRPTRIVYPFDLDACGSLLLTHYFKRNGALEVSDESLRTSIQHFIEELTAPTLEYRTVLVASQFDAENEFCLSDEVRFRRARAEDLDLLCRVYPWTGGFPLLDEHGWICDVRRQVRLDVYAEINARREVVDRVLGSLALVLPGIAAFTNEWSGLTAQFVSLGVVRSDQPLFTSRHGNPLHVTDRDVAALQEAHVALTALPLDREKHGLALAYRRLRSAATRREAEDQFVDYVVGLESLLAPDAENLEVTFRFRNRGAALLPESFGTPADRIKLMGKMYGLRSKIVHGSASSEEVAGLLPLAADCLRKILRWYLSSGGVPKTTVPELDRMMIEGGAKWARPE